MESSPKDHPSATAFLNFLKATNSAINFYFLKPCSPIYFSISQKILPSILSLRHNIPGLLKNRLLRHNSANTRQRIDITLPSDNSSWIQHRITSNFHIVPQHRAKLLHTGFDIVSISMHNHHQPRHYLQAWHRTS